MLFYFLMPLRYSSVSIAFILCISSLSLSANLFYWEKEINCECHHWCTELLEVGTTLENFAWKSGFGFFILAYFKIDKNYFLTAYVSSLKYILMYLIDINRKTSSQLPSVYYILFWSCHISIYCEIAISDLESQKSGHTPDMHLYTIRCYVSYLQRRLLNIFFFSVLISSNK